ncbi:MAG: arginase family protein [Candidatus Anstonellales archaeon]
MLLKFSFLGSEYDFDEAKYIIIPVIYGKPLSREAAIGIIRQSLNLPGYNNRYGIRYNDIPVYTFDLVIPSIDPSKAMRELHNILDYILSKNKIPIMIGGDHSITISTVGLFNRYILVDAHLDLYSEYEGSEYSHACVGRRLIEYSEEIYYYGVRVVEPEELDIAYKTLDRLEIDRFYLSVDLDVLDPIYIDTNVPSYGGKSYGELLEFIEGITGKMVLGMDFVETVDNPKSTYLTADLIANTLAILES